MQTSKFLILVTLALGVSISLSGQTPTASVIPAWTPPANRAKAKTAFAPVPTKGDNIFTGDAEKWLADSILQQEVGELHPVKDKDVQDYVEKVGNNLVVFSANPERHYVFTVVDNEAEDAFCLGAGRIYVDLGILRMVTSEDQLAAVLAHEIAHDQFGHIPKTVTRQLFWMTGVRKVQTPEQAQSALADLNAAYRSNDLAAIGERLLGWGRSDELQADKAGFYTMYKAGYNPEEMKNVFRHWVANEKESSEYDSDYMFRLIFGSHPPSSQRVTALKWESLWIKMPPGDESYKNPAFDAIKARVSKLK